MVSGLTLSAVDLCSNTGRGKTKTIKLIFVDYLLGTQH